MENMKPLLDHAHNKLICTIVVCLLLKTFGFYQNIPTQN
jgi:hypothetical protein